MFKEFTLNSQELLPALRALCKDFLGSESLFAGQWPRPWRMMVKEIQKDMLEGERDYQVRFATFLN